MDSTRRSTIVAFAVAIAGVAAWRLLSDQRIRTIASTSGESLVAEVLTGATPPHGTVATTDSPTMKPWLARWPSTVLASIFAAVAIVLAVGAVNDPLASNAAAFAIDAASAAVAAIGVVSAAGRAPRA